MALNDPYVTGTELADYLSITTGTGGDQLDLAVLAVSRWIEGYCRRQFNLPDSASARTFDADRSGVLWVDDIGNATISVATDSANDGTFATAWETSDFQTAPYGAISEGRPITALNAVGSFVFPRVSRRTGLVRVTAKWGWPAVPDDVKQAALIQAARVYKRRESSEGVLGFGEFGPVRVGARLDPDVEALLQTYRLAPVNV